jgi:hypothetical protein
MQEASIAVTVPHFAFSYKGLPYHISYLTFQDSRNALNTIIEFSDSPYAFCSSILQIMK